MEKINKFIMNKSKKMIIDLMKLFGIIILIFILFIFAMQFELFEKLFGKSILFIIITFFILIVPILAIIVGIGYSIVWKGSSFNEELKELLKKSKKKDQNGN